MNQSGSTASVTPALLDPGETRALPHLRQLDGVRAIAILLVLVQHLLPGTGKYLPLGVTGVGLFFVLSGFLITRILLQCRLEHDRDQVSRRTLLGRFYIRRGLRILPLYYLVLGILFAFNVTGIRERIGWHIGYLSNFYFSIVDIGTTARERHFWSLAVEEQFYLFWPLLMLFVPRRNLRFVAFATIIIAIAWRFAQPIHIRQSQANAWLTPPCMDLLGMGALLAMCSVDGFGMTGARNFLMRAGAWIGLPMLILFCVLHGFDVLDHLTDRLHYTATALAGAWLIGSAANRFGGGFGGAFGRFLSSPPIVYTGRISYGLYVIHPFVYMCCATYLRSPKRAAHPSPWDWQLFLAALCTSFVIATISWFCFERPINGMKRFFEYAAKSRDI